MTILAKTEHPTNQRSLAIAHQQFLDAIDAIAASEVNPVAPLAGMNNQLLRVLIIDDHRATTDTLFALTTKWGHDVRRAYDGARGMILAASFRPDVVLLDMLMPNLDGFQVARQIRTQQQLKKCFIVAVTGRTEAAHRASCYAAGVDLFLTKPVPPGDLRTLLSLESLRAKHSIGHRAKALALHGSVSYAD